MIFVDISLVRRECRMSGEFEIHFVRGKPWHCRTDITILDKIIKSATFDIDFKKSSI